MNKDMIIEALELLIEKRQAENEELALQNDYYFCIWTALIDHIGKYGGREAISEAITTLTDDHKKKLQRYIDDRFNA